MTDDIITNEEKLEKAQAAAYRAIQQFEFAQQQLNMANNEVAVLSNLCNQPAPTAESSEVVPE